jgi:signal transduction histidine kinase
MGSADVSETGEERERLAPWLTDASLSVAVTMVISLVIAADAESSPLPGVAWAIGFGALMFLRRHLSLTVLAVTVFGIFAYYALNLPPIGMVLPAVGALYSTAEVRRTSWAVLGAAVLIAVSTFYRFDDLDPRAQLTGYGFVTELALAAAAIALGSVVRLVRETRTQSARIAALTTAEESRAAEARMHSERVRISRDLHDTIGHTLSVASLHTSVAAEAVDPDDRAAALERVRGATSEALRELRRTVKVLREESAGATDPGPASALGLASISTIIEAARAAGLDVTVDLDVDPARLPRAVDAAAFRIVQESVTNVLRHSRASAARVSAQVHGDELIVRIHDDGHGGAADTAVGAGIRGMSERAGLLGGRLGAGPNGEGFEVIAHLPIDVKESE